LKKQKEVSVQSQSSGPEGELLLRTSPMPADTNANGDIFGGWIMSQMDIAGGMLAVEITGGRAVTIAVDAMKFIKPVQTGDIVCCYGMVTRIGTTSVTIRLEVWVKPGLGALTINRENPFSMVTEASYTYVAIDQAGRKRAFPKPAAPVAR
jgi:acyl-CoA thioesterase YciA